MSLNKKILIIVFTLLVLMIVVYIWGSFSRDFQFTPESSRSSCDLVWGSTFHDDYSTSNKDSCLLNLGLALKDRKICASIKIWDLQYRCLTAVAKEFKDPSICEDIYPESRSRFNYYYICLEESQSQE